MSTMILAGLRPDQIQKIQGRLSRRSVRNSTTGCLEYTGSLSSDGYGSVNIFGRTVGAHRIAYALAFGEPGESHVLHRCDVRLCLEPSHLFLGTHQDNMDDREAKGRNSPPRVTGERHGLTKITNEQALAIFADGRTYRAISAEYGICQQTVCNIKLGRVWSHVTGQSSLDAPSRRAVANPKPPLSGPRRGEKHGRAKLSDQQVYEILRDNRIARAIAADYRVSKSLVGQIKLGTVWRHITSPKAA